MIEVIGVRAAEEETKNGKDIVRCGDCVSFDCCSVRSIEGFNENDFCSDGVRIKQEEEKKKSAGWRENFMRSFTRKS